LDNALDQRPAQWSVAEVYVLRWLPRAIHKNAQNAQSFCCRAEAFHVLVHEFPDYLFPSEHRWDILADVGLEQ
jgi:hypothetical protein